jgi:ribonuclease BN (tRNA processing enzyme)
MRISVLGCGGGRGKGSRPTGFLIDERLLLDAGTATEVLGLKECAQINYIIITHAHIDHIGDLPFLAGAAFDLREEPIILCGTKEVIKDVSSHIFNWRIWPDFVRIPNLEEAKFSYRILNSLENADVGLYKVLPIPVNHTVPTVGYLIDDGKTAFAFTGDTYTTDPFWKVVRGQRRLRAIIVEASFPNYMEETAKTTGHLTPNLVAEELKKLNRRDVDVYVSHIKPLHREEVTMELRDLSKDLPIKVLEDGMEINL